MKSFSREEANIMSFKVLVNSKGVIVTEISGIPKESIASVFSGTEIQIIRQIISCLKPKLEVLHAYLEDELDALNHPAED